MLHLSRRHGHYLFSVIQAGITCGVASIIAQASFLHRTDPGSGVLLNWLLSWMVMVPIVLLLAPLIRRAVERLTVDDRGRSEGY